MTLPDLPSRSARSRGFTLVELLVVIAVIGMLIGLLLPAIQRARESGRRAQCANQLKQIGLAWQHHLDSFQALPTAGYTSRTFVSIDHGRPGALDTQAAGWAYQILPFLEQIATWEGAGATIDLDRAKLAMGQPIAGYYCPSRRAARENVADATPWCLGVDQRPFSGIVSFSRAQTDYAATNQEGTGVLARNWDGSCTSGNRRRKLFDFADITDGTSNTMLAGDKRMNVSELGKSQPGDNFGYTAGWDSTSDTTQETIRATNLEPLPDTTNGDGEKRFGSSHDGVFNALLVDGSVRTIPYTIDREIFARLGNRQDGETVTLP